MVSRETVQQLAAGIPVIKRSAYHAELVNGKYSIVDQRFLDDVEAETTGVNKTVSERDGEHYTHAVLTKLRAYVGRNHRHWHGTVMGGGNTVPDTRRRFDRYLTCLWPIKFPPQESVEESIYRRRPVPIQGHCLLLLTSHQIVGSITSICNPAGGTASRTDAH